jgi:hypothetical protein
MNLRQRIELLGQLGAYMQSSDPAWLQAREKAYIHNNWFIPAFVDEAVAAIATRFLQPDLLEAWVARYPGFGEPRNVGVVMAGNIPLVGFHDFLCVFLSGNHQTIKLSSKDNVLLPHLVGKLLEWSATGIQFSDILKHCDAYIATGSNNSSRYFDYYFAKYPSIIRRNRTSVAVLTGRESKDDLEKLADDVQLYFGLGCRNVTKLYVPEGYDFVPVLDALRKYQYFFDHNKYRNNYDYQLAIYLMNNRYYMTNDSIVLLEQKELFSPIGTLYYEFYKHNPPILTENADIQCVIGEGGLPFGQAQTPRLEDYADGVDTLSFLCTLV